MIIFQKEKLSDILDEAKPLFHEHWEEIAGNKDKYPLNVNYDVYLALDKTGALHVVTARDNGKLVGYVITIVLPHLHYMDCLTAMNDILMLKKEYRRGTTGIRMLKFSEESLNERGVMRHILHIKTCLDWGKIAERLGYIQTEKTYEKTVCSGR
jgi:hypothetical protein